MSRSGKQEQRLQDLERTYSDSLRRELIVVAESGKIWASQYLYHKWPYADSGRSKKKRATKERALTEVLNPKVALFFLSFLPQFVDPAQGSVAGQTLFFGFLFHVTGVPTKVLPRFWWKSERAHSSGELVNNEPAAGQGGHRRNAPWTSIPGRVGCRMKADPSRSVS